MSTSTQTTEKKQSDAETSEVQAFLASLGRMDDAQKIEEIADAIARRKNPVARATTDRYMQYLVQKMLSLSEQGSLHSLIRNAEKQINVQLKTGEEEKGTLLEAQKLYAEAALLVFRAFLNRILAATSPQLTTAEAAALVQFLAGQWRSVLYNEANAIAPLTSAYIDAAATEQTTEQTQALLQKLSQLAAQLAQRGYVYALPATCDELEALKRALASKADTLLCSNADLPKAYSVLIVDRVLLPLYNSDFRGQGLSETLGLLDPDWIRTAEQWYARADASITDSSNAFLAQDAERRAKYDYDQVVTRDVRQLTTKYARRVDSAALQTTLGHLLNVLVRANFPPGTRFDDYRQLLKYAAAVTEPRVEVTRMPLTSRLGRALGTVKVPAFCAEDASGATCVDRLAIAKQTQTRFESSETMGVCLQLIDQINEFKDVFQRGLTKENAEEMLESIDELASAGAQCSGQEGKRVQALKEDLAAMREILQGCLRTLDDAQRILAQDEFDASAATRTLEQLVQCPFARNRDIQRDLVLPLMRGIARSKSQQDLELITLASQTWEPVDLFQGLLEAYEPEISENRADFRQVLEWLNNWEPDPKSDRASNAQRQEVINAFLIRIGEASEQPPVAIEVPEQQPSSEIAQPSPLEESEEQPSSTGAQTSPSNTP